MLGLILGSVTFCAFSDDVLKTSFGDYREELRAASAEGKKLLLVFEMDGCPYCEHLNHALQEPKVAKYLASKYAVYRVDIKGSVAVSDLTGNRMSERDLAKRYNVTVTPTVIGFDANGKTKFKLIGAPANGDDLTAFLESHERGAKKLASVK